MIALANDEGGYDPKASIASRLDLGVKGQEFALQPILLYLCVAVSRIDYQGIVTVIPSAASAEWRGVSYRRGQSATVQPHTLTSSNPGCVLAIVILSVLDAPDHAELFIRLRAMYSYPEFASPDGGGASAVVIEFRHFATQRQERSQG